MQERSERRGRRRPPDPPEGGPVRAGSSGAADGSADETSADEARRRLRAHGTVPLEPDERIGVLLAPGESVVAVRRSVALERRLAETGGGLAGDLYVTTERLVHFGRVRIEYSLRDIQDAVEAEGALRLIVNENRGVEIRVPDPRVLRVEIGAVREAVRGSVAGTTLPEDEREEQPSSA